MSFVFYYYFKIMNDWKLAKPYLFVKPDLFHKLLIGKHYLVPLNIMLILTNSPE